MKKVLTTAAFALVVASMAFTSCTKKTENAKTVFAHWNGVFRNCDLAKSGTCTSLAEPAEGKIENIKLNINEGAGTVLTKKLANGYYLTTISLTKLDLSAALKEKMLVDKVILNDGDCLIPADLMNASFAAAGLPDKISNPVIIPKGDMPLTLEKPGMQTISSISIGITTTTSKHDYVGHVTLLR